MIETLKEYKQRTRFMWSSMPSCGEFCTSDGLRFKVDENGKFKPFYGNTLIFSLPELMINWMKDIQKELYDRCGFCLAEKLNPKTFHITEHDLFSSTDSMPTAHQPILNKIIAAICHSKTFFQKDIKLRSTCLFNMVNTSVVMGFEPANEETCSTLMQIYDIFQKQTINLSYPLTLHTTIAYYKPGIYKENEMLCLKSAFDEIGREQRDWTIDLKYLNFAIFDNMNSYKICNVSELMEEMCQMNDE